jgi:hypothetical protein
VNVPENRSRTQRASPWNVTVQPCFLFLLSPVSLYLHFSQCTRRRNWRPSDVTQTGVHFERDWQAWYLPLPLTFSVLLFCSSLSLPSFEIGL